MQAISVIAQMASYGNDKAGKTPKLGPPGILMSTGTVFKYLHCSIL